MYYHLSYWGAPRDYLWLSTNSPLLIAYEMGKALAYNGKKLWVFNVGDLKPAEMELNFALDLAYDATKWNAENAHEYARQWVAGIFGSELAEQIALIKKEFYRLAQEGKPEHLDLINYDSTTAEKRIADYKSIVNLADALQQKIPKRLQDAYFELVIYPVKGAFLMNEKVFFAKKSLMLAKQGSGEAIKYAQLSQQAFDDIKAITENYNNGIAAGKWSSMMSWHPRDLEIFKMPKIATAEMVAENKLHPEKSFDSVLPKTISITDFINKKDVGNEQIKIIDGLGITGKGISVLPITSPPFNSENMHEAPYVEYKINLSKGEHAITIKALPTQNINNEYGLHYAISVNGGQTASPRF